MEQIHQLRWEGPKRPRAKQISQETWREHETTICNLYPSTTLDELMETMKVSHGFKALRRQCIHQFEKWGLQKYSSTRTKPGKAGSRDCTSHEVPKPVYKSDSSSNGSITPAKAEKRRRSAQSAGSRSSRSSTSMPMKKKTRLATGTEPPENQSDGSTETNSHQEGNIIMPGSTKGSDIKTAQSVDGSDSSGASILMDRVNIDDTSINATFILEDQDSTSAFTSFVKRVFHKNTGHSTFQISPAPHRLKAAREVARLAKATQTRSLAHSLWQRDDQQTVRDVADYLQALMFRQEAFELYWVLLTAEEQNSARCRRLLTPLLISCARTATTQDQHTFVKDVLSNRLGRIRRVDAPRIELFLTHMLLAKTCSLPNEEAQRHRHLNQAREYPTDLGSDNSSVSSKSSLDLVAYIYYRHLHSLNSGLDSNQEVTCCLEPDLINYNDFVPIISALRQESLLPLGEFEIKYRGVGFYVRSSLDCCLTVLQAPVKENSTSSRPPRPQSAETKWDYIHWAETASVFTYLWEKWHELQPGHGDLSQWLWMVGSEDIIGLSASEVLSICCEMLDLCVERSAPWRCPISKDYLLKRFLGGAWELHHLSTRDLVTKFLRMCFARDMLIEDGEKYHAFQKLVFPPIKPQHIHTLPPVSETPTTAVFPSSSSQADIPEPSGPKLDTIDEKNPATYTDTTPAKHVHIVSHLSSIAFESTHKSQPGMLDKTSPASRPPSDGDQQYGITATLASSCRSSDMSMHRALKNRIQLLLRGSGNSIWSGNDLPSSLIRHSRSSQSSCRSSQLSQLMQSVGSSSLRSSRQSRVFQRNTGSWAKIGLRFGSDGVQADAS